MFHGKKEENEKELERAKENRELREKNGAPTREGAREWNIEEGR